MKKKIWPALKIIGIIWILSSILAMFFSTNTDLISSGNVAVIPMHGIITVSKAGGLSNGVTSDEVIKHLKKATENPNIKVIVLDINSPGGSGVAADEIGQYVKTINKTTVAVIRDMGTSAAYWVASATNKIYANKLSLVGSIGVIGSFLDFSEFINEHNISYQRYVTGEFKDMGSMFKKPTKAEEKLMQKIIDDMKDIFVNEVALNRNLDVKKVNEIANGQFYLGNEAKDLGLIDEIGTKENAFKFIENEFNITVQEVELKKKLSFSDYISEFRIGKFINLNPYFLFK